MAHSPKCVLCSAKLDPKEGDIMELKLCSSCVTRPEALRLGLPRAVTALLGDQRETAASKYGSARDFTLADKELIRKLKTQMQPEELLAILNKRLHCDLGDDAAPYTLQQLAAEIGTTTSNVDGGRNWVMLRKVLDKARRDGVLEAISEQVIDDFAVVFSLNARQVMSVKDIVLGAKEAD
jgi:hypothetical protein